MARLLLQPPKGRRYLRMPSLHSKTPLGVWLSWLLHTSHLLSRNICMDQWNKQQPNGQGLVSDFDTYFKALTVAEKEVCHTTLR
jgi:hypothetical protein